MERDIEEEILTQLHRDEKELKNEEKKFKIVSSLTLFLILILFAGLSYVIFYSQKSIIQTIVKEVPKEVEIVSSPTPADILATPSVSNENNSNVIQDYYINIGSGSNHSTEWTDVSGTLTTIDIGQYENIKEVHLETTTNVPTSNGTISVRLFNKTDNYAVWNSERTVESQEQGSLLISENIIYDKGPKLYQIQMKSQLGVLANLLQSRLHIVVQ